MTCINDSYYEYLDYLYKYANIHFPQCPEIDSLVQESLLAFFISEYSKDVKECVKEAIESVNQ